MKIRSISTCLLLAGVVVACSNKKDAGGDAGAGSKAEAIAGPANPVLLGHVKAHVEGCKTINVEAGQAYECPPAVNDGLRKFMNDSKPSDFVSTLVPLVRKKDDPKTAAVAVDILSESFDYLGESGKRINATPANVDAVIAAYAESTGARASRLSKVVAHLATLAKTPDKAFAAASAHSTKNARDEVYKNILTFGRLDAFPKLQEAAKKPEHLDAALDAVRYMYKPTEAERAAVCPWAKESLGHADGDVAASAGNDMVYCKGPYIDALITEAEKRLKDKQYKNPFAAVMREPCFEFMSGVTKSAADTAQCDRVYAFLEKASNDTNVDDATRGLALWNIYYQRRDITTLKLMRKYEKSPNKEVAKRAQEAIKSLTETYKLKG